MNEQELRSLVRSVIASHTAAPARESNQPGTAAPHLHASHVMFALPADPHAEGRCLIEPAVMCNHCGFCKSWGH
jgi:hypothetical protein